MNANESNETAKPNMSPFSAPHLTLHFLDFKNFYADFVHFVAFKLLYLRKRDFSARPPFPPPPPFTLKDCF